MTRFVTGTLLAVGLAMATHAGAEAIADLQLRVVRLDPRNETAMAVVDSIWDPESTVDYTRSGLSVGCLLPGADDGAARIRRGDVFRFKLIKQGGYRLLVPSTGWPVTCHCGAGRSKSAVLQGAFVRDVGLDDSVRLRGHFGPRKPGPIRVRIGWRSQDLSANLAEDGVPVASAASRRR